MGTIVAQWCDEHAETWRQGPMLRITVRGVAEQPVLQLEGCICGPWVDELETSWRAVRRRTLTGAVHVDLRAVCHVDARGRVLMKRMLRDGAQFLTSGFVMPEIVRELACEPPAPSVDART